MARERIRPSKLTRKRLQLLEEKFRIGGTIEATVNACGVSYPTFRQWIRDGEAQLDACMDADDPEAAVEALLAKCSSLSDREVRQFSDLSPLLAVTVERVTAEVELRNVGIVQGAAQPTYEKQTIVEDGEAREVMVKTADGDWHAAAWWLERRFPGRYGRRRVELSGPDGGAIKLEQLDEQLAKEAADLEAQLEADGGGGSLDAKGEA